MPTPSASFVGRLIISITIIMLAITLWKLANVLLLIFGAVLFAIGLRAATRRVSRLTGLPNWLTLTLVIVVGTVAIIALFWIFGTAIAAQFDNVVQTVPAGFNLLIETLRGYAYGPQILEQARGVNVLGATSWITSMLTIAARSIAIGVGYVAITFFVAIYLAAQPERYRHLVS
jgi:predicted PurR-regulated permease PerM